MMNPELIDKIIELLAPDGFTERSESEAKYPKRLLGDGAIVTRSAPSPTGFVHIGTVYMSLINKLIALHTRGVNMLRVEDTDKKREIKDGVAKIVNALELFDLKPDEGVDKDGKSYGEYGPYLQSERGKIYLGYAVDLLKKGRAYPCFATQDELDSSYKEQQTAKVRPGYYGQWALWRDKGDAEIGKALEAGKPFVLRFRSQGSHDKRLKIDDMLKGSVELPENDLDIPLIKSDEHRLPTYHLAHVVDDSLMKTNLVVRGDEWLPNTPLHIELAEALGIMPFHYAHFTPINIMDGTSRRKLSKRKDPEADISFFLAAGYPTKAILEYLVGLANSSFEDWRKANPAKPIWDFPFSFEKWAKTRGALLDIQKLDDVSKDFIVSLSQEDYEKEMLAWAKDAAPYLSAAVAKDPTYASKVFAVEREGEKKRKDLAKWSDAPEQYGYFFDDLFKEHFATRIDKELSDVDAAVVTNACQAFLGNYDPKDDQATWLEKCRSAAGKVGLDLRDFARIIRVKLTGKNRAPDLYTIMQVMGMSRVGQRLS